MSHLPPEALGQIVGARSEPDAAGAADDNLAWAAEGWEHTLTREGHRWRWRASYRDPGGKLTESDFGLVPGGVFVAISALVRIARRAP